MWRNRDSLLIKFKEEIAYLIIVKKQKIKKTMTLVIQHLAQFKTFLWTHQFLKKVCTS